jgi:hypothetical protein
MAQEAEERLDGTSRALVRIKNGIAMLLIATTSQNLDGSRNMHGDRELAVLAYWKFGLRFKPSFSRWLVQRVSWLRVSETLKKATTTSKRAIRYIFRRQRAQTLSNRLTYLRDIRI